ncbi:hypothetical protein FRC04_000682 [Tulasnella sp. 424]|nr:hypothetical protein FRC04_000682 [Tulasnella sp. 424]KAG8967708.1 hypothetical protein FRC05_001966 [Tulasnella sp. 425]
MRLLLDQAHASLPGDIVFTGSDGLSCHHFIRAIREQALKSEKQTDNRWMADHASIRFDGDALKWFENLEDEVQTDWRLLRRAILSHYSEPAYAETINSQSAQQSPAGLIFTGKDKVECRSFVREIRLRAAAAGKENDSNWMIRLAFPCFAGDTLEWHASLPADVQNEWRSLERAILIDYPVLPTLAISPARIRIDNWFSAVPPSRSLQAIRSQADWLAQARDRRKMYLEANNPSIPCWLLVENGDGLPKNAIRTGSEPSGSLYSARAWCGSDLLLGKCGQHLEGAHLPLGGKAIRNVTPFEVLVGDPLDFQWISIPEKSSDGRGIRHRPFMAVDSAFADFDTASLVFQARHETGWHPGKAHMGQTAGYFCYGGKEEGRPTILVLAWAD